MRDLMRTRWAAVGAAVAVTLGAGGISLTQAAISTGDKPVYVALAEPCRLVDTRPAPNNIGPKDTPIAAGEANAYEIQVTGANGNCTGPLAVPAGAVAVATNVTVINPNAPSGRSFFTVYPADAPSLPVTSNLNFVSGQPPTPNKVDVGLSADGKIKIYNADGTANVAVDVFGYYIDHNHDDRYYTEAEVDAAIAAIAGTRTLVASAGGEQQENVSTPILGSGGEILRSVTIDVPSNGTLVAQASASVRGTQAGRSTPAECGISTGGAVDDAAAVFVDVDENQDLPISAVRALDATPGSVTVNFVCSTFITVLPGPIVAFNSMDVFDSSLVVTFVPD